MILSDRVLLPAILVLAGAGWGITQPLTKIAVSTGHGHFGLIFWQLVIGFAVLGTAMVFMRMPLPLSRPALRVYLVIALIGTLLPNTASYQAAVHLPAGVLSILLSLIPMLAFPMALLLRLENFRMSRLFGLAAGLAGVSLLILPEASLPDPVMILWVPIALIAALCYAFEGNYVSKWGTGDLHPVQVLCGASLVGALIAFPLMLGANHWIDPRAGLGGAEMALIASSVIHVLVYAAYVWLVGRAGSVFAVQVSYFVTLFGVVWAMLILGERYSPYIWAALFLILVGMFLVQPRPKAALALHGGIGENSA